MGSKRYPSQLERRAESFASPRKKSPRVHKALLDWPLPASDCCPVTPLSPWASYLRISSHIPSFWTGSSWRRVSLSVCVFLYLACLCVCLSVYFCLSLSVCVSLCVLVCLSQCFNVRLALFVYVSLPPFVCVCVCVCVNSKETLPVVSWFASHGKLFFF